MSETGRTFTKYSSVTINITLNNENEKQLPADFRVIFKRMKKLKTFGEFNFTSYPLAKFKKMHEKRPTWGSHFEQIILQDRITRAKNDSLGFLTTPGYGEGLRYSINNLRIIYSLTVKNPATLILSCIFLQLAACYAHSNYVDRLTVFNRNADNEELTMSSRNHKKIQVTLFISDVFLIFMNTFSCRNNFNIGYKLLYSYHKENITQLSPGIFDCSKNYESLKPHLACNKKVECEGGEDETNDCPYTSPLCPLEHFYLNVNQENQEAFRECRHFHECNH